MSDPQKNPASRIQEQRTIEATKNNLMGFNGKLGCIAKNLGDPIIAEHSGGQYFSSNEMTDYLNLDQDEEEQIRSVHFTMGGHTLEEPGDVDPTWSRKLNKEYSNTEHLGWFFDGLGRGIHLEIKCISEEGKITVNFKGFLVYEETAGELSSYNPNGDWQKHIDKLYEVAKTKERKTKNEEKKISQEASLKKKTSWLKELRDKWGI